MSVTGPSGTPFLLSLSETSGTVSFTSPVVATTPGIYRISGTPSALTTQTTSFIYKLTTDGSSCNGASTVSGTITITPLVGISQVQDQEIKLFVIIHQSLRFNLILHLEQFH